MSSFIAVPPRNPTSLPSTVVEGDGWYPAIDGDAMRDALRIGEMVTNARLRGAIEGAQVTVEGELVNWRREQERYGAADLAAVEPNRKSGGIHRLTLIYTRAIRFHAAAELAETHRDLTATQDGQARAETEATTAEEYLRRATHAVRDILGATRTTVELI